MAARRRRRSSRRARVVTKVKTRRCRSFKVKCAGKLYRCHPGRTHRKGMFCKLIGKAPKARRRSRSR